LASARECSILVILRARTLRNERSRSKAWDGIEQRGSEGVQEVRNVEKNKEGN
jgi:hypothetical protein